tara:strand:+ start:7554 stop:8516 length:963 start_codon:yes stop_codon:yes gene_type:complete
MIEDMGLPTKEMTSSAFKKQLVEYIQHPDFRPELLRQLLSALPENKRVLLEEYRVDTATEAIEEDQQEWLRPSYFFRQTHFAELNFCQKRIEHLIMVKSHLIQHKIAGFSKAEASVIPKQSTTNKLKDSAMGELASVNLTGYQPSKSLANSVNRDDLSAIRMALFMEMNDKRLSTTSIRQALAWTLSRHPNLFVPYEESVYSQSICQDTSLWDSSYYGIQEVYTTSNFSEKRLSHMLAVREHVFIFNIQETSASNSASKVDSVLEPKMRQTRNQGQSSNAESQQQSQTQGASSQNSLLTSLLLIGGAIAVIAAVILSIIV